MRNITEKLMKNCVEGGVFVCWNSVLNKVVCESGGLYTILAQVFHAGFNLLNAGFPRNPHRTITTNI